jgi:hypothetical protein
VFVKLYVCGVMNACVGVLCVPVGVYVCGCFFLCNSLTGAFLCVGRCLCLGVARWCVCGWVPPLPPPREGGPSILLCMHAAQNAQSDCAILASCEGMLMCHWQDARHTV